MQPTNPISGLFYGGGFSLLGVQCLAVLVAGTWTSVFTGLIIYFMKITVCIDVDTDVEEKGLDIC